MSTIVDFRREEFQKWGNWVDLLPCLYEIDGSQSKELGCSCYQSRLRIGVSSYTPTCRSC